MLGPRNLLLFALSRLVRFPPHHTTVPARSDCRIYHEALSQEDCGACAAFAVSALVAMRACLYEGRDYIPSPYRIFDCAGAKCEMGLSPLRAVAVANFGVGDLRDSEQRFGLPCDLRWEQQVQLRLEGLLIYDALQIKAALLFFGPLLGAARFPVDRDNLTGVYNFQSNEAHQHAMVVVGWAADGTWIVQNSWGDEWGDDRGRGRVSQDVIVHAIDPSMGLLKDMYLVAIAFCLAMYCCLERPMKPPAVAREEPV